MSSTPVFSNMSLTGHFVEDKANGFTEIYPWNSLFATNSGALSIFNKTSEEPSEILNEPVVKSKL